jgi:hypothetical protein
MISVSGFESPGGQGGIRPEKSIARESADRLGHEKREKDRTIQLPDHLQRMDLEPGQDFFQGCGGRGDGIGRICVHGVSVRQKFPAPARFIGRFSRNPAGSRGQWRGFEVPGARAASGGAHSGGRFMMTETESGMGLKKT